MEQNILNRQSLYDISWQVTEEEYRANPAYSFSTIAKYNRDGFEGLSKLFDKIESPSLTFGSIVDTLITGTKEEFDSKYIVAEWVNLADSLIVITKTLFNLYKDKYTTIKDFPDTILSEVGASCNYYAASRYDNYRVKQIRENCEEYYNLLYVSQDKTLISSSDYFEALQCVEILKTNPNTRRFFVPNPFNKNVETFYQLKFKSKYLDYDIRCMADLIIVDHEKKLIIPCDLKTSYKPEYKFYKSFIEWGYWIQAQLYWYIIRQILNQSDLYKDYTLLDYHFIVISKGTKNPLVWIYPDTQVIVDLTYGKNNSTICKNFRNILPELDEYLKTKPKCPKGIQEINNLKDWLNNE
jgi:hypothetical protein